MVSPSRSVKRRSAAPERRFHRDRPAMRCGLGGPITCIALTGTRGSTRRYPRKAMRDYSVEAELVALDVLHHKARLVDAIGSEQSHADRAERDQSRAFGLKDGQALVTLKPGADPHVKVQPILDDLAFGNALEEQARAHPRGIDAGERLILMLRRQRAFEIVPRRKPFRWGRYDVPQHLAPKACDALRLCAVERDLELPDGRHRSTIGTRARLHTLRGTVTAPQPKDPARSGDLSVAPMLTWS